LSETIKLATACCRSPTKRSSALSIDGWASTTLVLSNNSAAAALIKVNLRMG
jgi:hypothetical protein